MQPELRIPAQSAVLATEQNKVLRNTYMLLGLSMIPTVIGAWVGVNTDFSWMAQHPIAAPLVMLAVIIGTMFAVSALRNSIWGVVAMLGFTFLMGWWLGPMLQYALHFRNGAQLIALAAGGTGAIFLGVGQLRHGDQEGFQLPRQVPVHRPDPAGAGRDCQPLLPGAGGVSHHFGRRRRLVRGLHSVRRQPDRERRRDQLRDGDAQDLHRHLQYLRATCSTCCWPSPAIATSATALAARAGLPRQPRFYFCRTKRAIDSTWEVWGNMFTTPAAHSR